MDEETTTSTSVDDAAVQDTGTADDNTEQAVDDGQETDETTSSESEDTQVSDDDDKAWAEKKGLPMDDPVALAKMIREGDRKVTQASQQAAELRKSVETAGETMGNDDVQQLRNEVAIMNFFQSHPEAREVETEMAATLEEKPYFANDLEGLLFYTKGREADKAALAARQTGGKEALATNAAAERAAAPRASATTRTSPKELTDADIRDMSVAEYQAAKAEGKIDPWGARP